MTESSETTLVSLEASRSGGLPIHALHAPTRQPALLKTSGSQEVPCPELTPTSSKHDPAGSWLSSGAARNKAPILQDTPLGISVWLHATPSLLLPEPDIGPAEPCRDRHCPWFKANLSMSPLNMAPERRAQAQAVHPALGTGQRANVLRPSSPYH